MKRRNVTMTNQEIAFVRREHHRLLRNIVLYSAVISFTAGYVAGTYRDNKKEMQSMPSPKIETVTMKPDEIIKSRSLIFSRP